MERSERSTSAREHLAGLPTFARRCRLKWTVPASRTRCILPKLLILFDTADHSVTFCSRSFHPIRCDFVASFAVRTGCNAQLLRPTPARPNSPEIVQLTTGECTTSSGYGPRRPANSQTPSPDRKNFPKTSSNIKLFSGEWCNGSTTAFGLSR